MSGEDDTEDFARNGRRTSDGKVVEGLLPPSRNSFIRSLFTGFIALGGVTALIATGRASYVLDTAVADNLKQDKKIELIITQLHINDIEQDRLLSTLEMYARQRDRDVEQQNKSDAEFLKVITPIKQQLNDINNGVRGNREAIIIMNGKVTSTDNTSVNYLASR